jgi:hypothetical protein
MTDHPENNFDLPPEFRHRLKAAAAPPGQPIPDQIDRAILAHAHATITRRRKLRRMLTLAAALATAAAICIVIGIMTLRPATPAHHPDIVDAYLLEKRRLAGDPSIKPSDVQSLILLAVKIDPARGGSTP